MHRAARPGLNAVILLLSFGAYGADFYLGVDAYNRGDYETAYREFSALAGAGHIDGQNNLGVMFNTGRGVDRNFAEAARWYRKAAERGHASAQTNLAILYATGQGVEKNEVIAYAWFSLAAEQGTEQARENRDRLATQLSDEQIAQAQSLVSGNALLSAPKPTPTSALQAPASTEPPSKTGERADAGRADSPAAQFYGPVAAGETLWSIAAKTKPEGVSVQQMMLALLRANPQAFSAPRVDRLNAHSRLFIPGRDKALAVGVEQAKAEIERQLSN